MPKLLSFIYIALLLASFSSMAISESTAIEKNGQYHLQLQQPNATGVEIHFILELLNSKENPQSQQQLFTQVVDNSSVATDLENMIIQVLNGKWSNSFLLLELADRAEDIDVKTTIFEILFNALQPTKKIYNPFELIELYQAFETHFQLHSSSNNISMESFRIANVRSRLRSALTSRCAQILEAFAHLPNSSYDSDTPNRLLRVLNKLDDQIFVETLEQVYDAVQDLVSVQQLAHVVSNFSINTKQSAIANLLLLARLNNASESNVTRALLVDNLKALPNYEDFGKLTPQWRLRVNAYLPISMRNLYGASKVCLRNATNSARYLYECPQTYLMCTNGRQLQQAAFIVDSNRNGGFAFRSLYWTNRYIHLEGNATLSGNLTSPGAFIKNVYSKLGAAYWQVVYHGENIALLDSTLQLCLCGGNRLAWNSEQHVYTRRAIDFVRFRQECEWFVEDCSRV